MDEVVGEPDRPVDEVRTRIAVDRMDERQKSVVGELMSAIAPESQGR